MDRILVFIPVYNCQKQIARVLAKFNDTNKHLFSEILIVDNQSTDKTLEACRTAMQNLPDLKITLVQNTMNYNLGGSHKVAFNYAIEHDFDYVIVLHGDDQGDIQDIVGPIQKKAYREMDCLLGARFMRNSRLVNYSKFRTFGNIMFNYLFSFCCGRRLYDLGSGLNLYSVSFLKNKFYLRFPNALTFNYYMILYTIAVKAKFRFFPLSWKEIGQVSNVKLFKQTRQLLKVLALYCFSRTTFMTGQHEKDRPYPYQEISTCAEEL